MRIRMAMVAILLAVLALPAVAQDYSEFFSDSATRGANMVVLVWDPDRMVENADGTMSPDPGYVSMPLTTLLDGLVVFDDNRRYVALKPFDTNNPTQPMFDATDFSMTYSGVGIAEGIPVPTLTGTPVAGWLAVAVPEDVPLDYVAFGTTNPRNLVFLFSEQAGGTITLDGDPYYVWSSGSNSVSLLLPDTFVFFSPTATVPE